MTESTQRLIDALTTSLEKGIDLAPGYVQSLVHRYATYQIWVNSLYSSLGLFLIIFGIIGCYKAAKSQYPDEHVLEAVLCGACIMFGTLFLCLSVGNLLEAMYTPEMSLLNSLKF